MKPQDRNHMWRKWFAWRPVIINASCSSVVIAWFRRVERRKYPNGAINYREIRKNG